MSYIKQKDAGGDTYTLKATQDGVNVDLQLDAAAGTDSEVKLKAGTNITLTEASDSISIDAAGAGGSIGVNQVAFGDPSNAGDIKGSNNFTFVDETTGFGPTMKLQGDKPRLRMVDDTDATVYTTLFFQSGASGQFFHEDSTGVSRPLVRLASSTVIINESANDVDVRIEGLGDENLIRTNAAVDKVGIGGSTGSGDSKLTVNSGSARDTLDLISTQADSNGGPNLRMFRDSGSPIPGDTIAQIGFYGKDDAGNRQEYARISSLVSDETGATEDGWLQFGASFAGNIQPNMMTIRGDVPEIVVNEGSADVNFRVESNANANMFKVDAGTDIVTVGSAPTGTAVANGTLQVRDKTISSYAYLGFSNTGVASEELDNDRMQSQIIVHKGASDHTYELPTGVAGMYFKFVSTSGNITIQPDTGDTINGGAAGASVTRTTDNQIYECLCHTANTWIVSNP